MESWDPSRPLVSVRWDLARPSLTFHNGVLTPPGAFVVTLEGRVLPSRETEAGDVLAFMGREAVGYYVVAATKSEEGSQVRRYPSLAPLPLWLLDIVAR